MIKTLALDTPNIKITDNDTPIKLTPYDDGVKLEAGTWTPTVYIASGTSAFTKSIPAIWEGNKVVIQSSTLADLPVDNYDVEVWLNDGSEQLIYPDYGYVELNINQTVAGINANLISSVTVAEFRDMFESLATDINTSIADLAVDSNVVHKTGNETVADTKTFSSPIAGSVTGNAGTSTKLTTARSIQTNLASTVATNFDGTANITPGVTGILPPNNGGTGRADGSATSLYFPQNAEKDLNNYLTTGQFKIDSTFVNVPANLPNGAFLFVYQFDAGLRYQTLIAREIGNTTAGSTIWTRLIVSGTWGPWQSIAKDDNVVHNAIGKVIINSSSSVSGESVGTWSNIGSATIGSTTVYYWKRTA